MRLRLGSGGGWLMVLGVVLAAAAAGVVWTLARSAQRTARVLVAAQDVPALTVVTAAEVRVRAVPVQAVPRDALHAPGQAVGRFVRYGLLAGQVVRAANLAATAAGASRFDEQLTAAARHRPDLRAVTLSVTPQAGLVLPVAGDRVDLLAVVAAGKSVSKQARVLVQHALVLDRVATGGGSAAGKPKRAGPAQIRQGLLVLALTVPQAEQVALAQATGTVQVMLDPLGRSRPVRVRPLTPAAWRSRPQAAVQSIKGGR